MIIIYLYCSNHNYYFYYYLNNKFRKFGLANTKRVIAIFRLQDDVLDGFVESEFVKEPVTINQNKTTMT